MEDTKEIWRAADAVCFDVDSTVIQDEGIDELAKFLGVGAKVELLTKTAMNGGLNYQDALKARLDICNPAKAKIEKFHRSHPPRFTPGMKDLVKKLHDRGVQVFLVSGGFWCLIREVAQQLNIPDENVYCNRLFFYFDGSYAGFDTDQFTASTGGKARAVDDLKQKYSFERLVMIGDGATDMEASPPADAFIGFGANQIRKSVQEEAQWYVTSVKELSDALDEY